MTDVPHQSLLGRVTTSSINYWATIATDAIAAAAFGWLGAARFHGSLIAGLGLAIGGFLTWSLAEYLLHRCVLHGWSVARKEHAKHHRDTHALISTPVLVIPLLATILCIALAVATPLGHAALFICGLYAGYNYFVIVHHLQHFHPELLARSSFFARNLHLHQLHHRYPETHFGISSSIWDRAFGSMNEER